MAALVKRDCPGLDPTAKGHVDRAVARAISQAMEQAGIRPSRKSRKVQRLRAGASSSARAPATRTGRPRTSSSDEVKRRVRLYLVRSGATAEERKTIERAALREFQLLESLQHPGILRTYGFTEHELGPALIFEHDPQADPAGPFLAQQQDKLSIDTRLDLVRQIAEVVRYAHDKKVIHRALSPAEHPRHPGPDNPSGRGSRSSTGRSATASRQASTGVIPRSVIGHIARRPAGGRRQHGLHGPRGPHRGQSRASTSTSSRWARSPTTSSRACRRPPTAWS